MNNEDNNDHVSADDALEPTGDMFVPARDEEKLESDYEPPATPAALNVHHIPPNHPSLDTDIDSSELYGEGIGEATDIDEREILPIERGSPLEPEDNE